VADDAAFLSVKVEGIETLGNVDFVEVEDDDRLIDKATVVFDDAAASRQRPCWSSARW